MRKFAQLALVLAIALLVVASDMRALRRAPSVHALTTQHIGTYTGTLSAETTVLTGAADTAMHVYSVDLAAVSTGSIWTFKDGTAGTTVWKVYLVASTPRSIVKLFGQNGLALTQNVLTATPGSAATLAFNARYSNQ